MTFIDAISNLSEKIKNKTNYPMNVLLHFNNAFHIDYEFENKRKIDDILLDKIPNHDYVSIVWIDNQDKINQQSLNSYCKVSNENKSLDLTSFLSQYEFVGQTQDNNFNIYFANKLQYDQEIERDGFLHNQYYDYFDTEQYRFENIKLPNIQDYRYQNLYKYEEENEFINAILLEFILRQVRYNKLSPDEININIKSNQEKTSGEEIEFREYQKFQEEENKLDSILRKNFGLRYEEIVSLQNYHRYSFHDLLEDAGLHTKLALSNKMLSEKDIFDNEMDLCLNLKEIVSNEYLMKVNQVLAMFPKSFKKKQDDLIKALYIFDCIQAKKLETDQLDKQYMREYTEEENNIKQKYKKKIDKKIEELEQTTDGRLRKRINQEINLLEKNQEEAIILAYKPNMGIYPKMNQMEKDSVFHELVNELNEPAGQLKKLHSHIHKFLELKI